MEGVFNGYDDGTFKGDQPINRAELSKVLVLGNGVGEEDLAACADGASKHFSDVEEATWYTDYVYCAQAMGWVNGDAGTTHFRPADNVNLAEAFKMIVHSKVGRPADLFEGTAWYDIYVNYLKTGNSINGDPQSGYHFTYSEDWMGKLDDEIDRADVAELIYRLQTITIATTYTQIGDQVRIEDETLGMSLSLPIETLDGTYQIYTHNPSGVDN